jgi:putative ABC transport system permease protein
LNLRLLREAFRELRSHRMRTILASIGVAIVVVAFTLVVQVGEIGRREITQGLEGLQGKAGTVVVTIEGDSLPGLDKAAAYAEERLERYGAEGASRATLLGARVMQADADGLPIDPNRSPCGVEQAPDGEYTAGPCELPIFGVDTDLAGLVGLRTTAGRWFEKADETSAAIPIILTQELARWTRDADHPTIDSLIGSTIAWTDSSQRFVIVGVVAHNVATESLGFFPGVGLVPAGASDRVAPPEVAGSTSTTVFSLAAPPEAAESIAQAAGDDVQRFMNLNNSPASAYGQRADQLEELAKALRILNLVLTGIAVVTMGVGSIGVLNVSLMSVKARVREFGVRRAVGARPRDLATLVLAESAMVGLIAGVIGVAVAWVIFTVFIFFVGDSLGASVDPGTGGPETGFAFRTALTGLLTAVGTGLVAGLIPAIRAAKLSVLEAIRR